ncbi:potassium transport protein Kup [Devosia sp. H5989]|nr:potassium transport protein Kup [Devosia sp. H5989]
MTQVDVAGPETGSVEPEQAEHAQKHLPVLILGALGVVYGDIGTSPLYAFREALHGATDGTPEHVEVLGILSLIFWALTIVVTIKYVGFVLRADNKGEGGTLSLMSLARSSFANRPAWVLFLGVIGASLFFGDAIITPAISVLSAVEGLEIIQPNLTPWVVPITVVVLIILFTVQRFGTGGVATVFGPVMGVWFLALGLSGLNHLVHNPSVLVALNPYYGVLFIIDHAHLAAIVLGAVFLAVTGAEALYVDLGHFGRKPITIAWLWMVFPCLLLNYFGQGAFVLGHTEAASNPFFQMQPEWALVPMVALATAATVIASQAVISGAYSLTRQAINLNLLPRMDIRHTSENVSGQIYMPYINSLLLVLVLVLVVAFRSSTSLSAAYGIAVTGEMLVTAVLLLVVMWRIWKWGLPVAIAIVTPLFIIDLGFFVSNLTKFTQGGWVPALVSVILIVVMSSWMAGRRRLAEKTRRDEVPLEFLVQNLTKKKPTIVPGTAIFLTSDIEGAPTALLHSLKHYKVLHERNVILTVVTSSAPTVADDEKVRIDAYNELFWRVIVTFGYMETPNIPKALGLARKLGWKFDIMSTSFFLSRRVLKPSAKRGPIRSITDRIFMTMARNASDATEYFHIPTGRVVEIGTQLTI